MGHVIIIQKFEDPQINMLTYRNFPYHLFPSQMLIGIPHAMANTLTGTFWGTPLEDIALWAMCARKKNKGVVDSLDAKMLNCQLQILLAKHS